MVYFARRVGNTPRPIALLIDKHAAGRCCHAYIGHCETNAGREKACEFLMSLQVYGSTRLARRLAQINTPLQRVRPLANRLPTLGRDALLALGIDRTEHAHTASGELRCG